MKPFPRGPVGARKLNNLVTELLNIRGPAQAGPMVAGKTYSFVNPRTGWVFISNTGSAQATLIPEGSAEAMAVPLNEQYGDAHEAMRFLPAGKYTMTTPSAQHLVVRAIPELYYSTYNMNSLVTEFGKFEGAFQEKYVFKNINTLWRNRYIHDVAPAWVGQGKRWMAKLSFVKWPKEQQSSEDAIYKYLAEMPEFALPYCSGIIVNEFGNSSAKCGAWAKAVDRVLSEPRLRGKGFYPYVRDLMDGPEGRELMRVVMKHNGAILLKRYLKEQRTEDEAWRHLQDELVGLATRYRTSCPGAIAHVVLTVGMFVSPPEGLDTFPHVDYKTYLDMQFNVLARDPSFDGLRGLMSYSCHWSDEETVRWIMRLFRHYAIEGKTEMLGKDPYVLTHLGNGDFEQGAEGWSLGPAEPGSIRFDTYPGFGRMQGRYKYPTEGDTVLVVRRSKNKPNVFSQEIRDLEPGRLYSFRAFTGDFQDMSKREEHAVVIKLDNVNLISEKCFTHVFPNYPGKAHSYPPYDGDKKKAWMNYHWRIFRAKGETARMTFSDWASDEEPAGPVGQELMVNFVQVQPYFDE